jgi:predicted dehydrogenase
VTSRRPGISRRRFLEGAAGLAAAPYVVTSSALGAGARPPASERIVMGAIGTGGMGIGNTRAFLGRDDVQFVAVCDVDRQHREEARQLVNEKYGNADCAAYADFREMLARGDLDAVCTALPDHWHAIPAIAAARAGIDVYGEKPLARSVREGRAICDAVERYGRVWQTGSWQRSSASFRRACELVRNGRLGRVYRVEVGLPGSPTTDPQPSMPVPDGLDWDLWLGPAPWAPYTELRCHYNWRWMRDYACGGLTDWGGHHIDIAHWGLGLDLTGPVEVWGEGKYPDDGLYDVPHSYRFQCRYADGLEMTVGDNGQLDQGTRWYGEEGWLHVARKKLEAEPAGILSEQIGPGEERLYYSNWHHGNFIECVKSRRPTAAPPEVAQRSISVALLGEIAMLTGRRIRWDPGSERILDDPGAAALLGRPYRQPWRL